MSSEVESTFGTGGLAMSCHVTVDRHSIPKERAAQEVV